MNLSISKRKDGRKYLSIQKQYWIPETKSRTSKTVKSLGYLDELEKIHDDPIAHFKEIVKKMTEEDNERRRAHIAIDMDEVLAKNETGAMNLGYVVPMKLYHELWLDAFMKGKMAGEDFSFNTNSIMILLVISRILSPGSKKKAYDGKNRYFERFDFTLDDVYRALSHFAKIADGLQQSMYERVRKKYGSNTSLVYYDVTNYHFEIDKPDDNRKYGRAKQNRKKPIVQMGLAMDADGVPIHYELFPGNKLDKETFRSVIGKVRRNYSSGRIVVVGDMGVVTGDNINYLVGNRADKPQNGYIFSFSVRGGTEKFKEYVLDPAEYKDKDGNAADANSAFKIKSRIIARDINVTMSGGGVSTRQVYEKQIVFWNEKYFAKARSERAEMLAKAEKLIASPGSYTKATSYGAAAYVSNISYDKKTGEAKGRKGKQLVLNAKKISDEEKYDGYYSIVTSELHMSDEEMIEAYRGLWEIEETFKITKSDLSLRPVYVSNYDHIEGHFLICFISLVILRLIQKQTGKRHSTAAIIDCLNKIECINEHENIYLFGYRSEISDLLGNVFGIDFTKKRLCLYEIKKLLGDAKK